MKSVTSKNFYEFVDNNFTIKKVSRNEFLFSLVITLLTFIVFFIIYSNWVLTSAHWDLGWIKQVIWHNIYQKMPSDCCSVDGNNSIYISWAWHFTPLFTILSLISFLWPFSSISWLIMFLAAAPALLVFFTCNIVFSVKNYIFKNRITTYTFPVLLALTFGTIRALAFPHYEIYFLVLVLSALYAAIKRNKILFVLSIIMIIMLKEDTAFYLIILAWFIGFKKIKTIYLLKTSFFLLIIPVTYLVSLTYVNFDDPINPNFAELTNLESQYLGKPLFSHISVDFIINRFTKILQANDFLIIFIIFLTVMGFLIKDYLTLRLMLSTLPYFIVSLMANSWVKGEMLNYELIPIWTSVLLAVLFFPAYKINSEKFREFIKKVFFIFILLGLFNGSTNQIIRKIGPSSVDGQALMSIDYIIEEAKNDSVLLDTNFFVYHPDLVSYGSWLNDFSRIKPYDCFLHLPISKTKSVLEKNYPNLIFDTKLLENSIFQKTCTSPKKSFN